MRFGTDRESLTVNAWRIVILVGVIAIWQWGWDYKERLGWLVPNLLASTFYGESAYQPRFGARTSSGLALLLVLYGVLGALFGLVVRDQGSRLRMTLLGLIFGVGWFFLSFDVLWKYVNPMVRMYSPDRAMLVGHLLYGGLLGRRFPLYLRSMSAGEGPAEPPTLPEPEPPESAGSS